MTDSHSSARPPGFTIGHIVLPGQDNALCGTRVPRDGVTGSDPCVVCTALRDTTAGQRARAVDFRGPRITATRYANAPRQDAARRLLPLSPGDTCSDLSPVFHTRCSKCHVVNDVPSLPTICYSCKAPLAAAQSWM